MRKSLAEKYRDAHRSNNAAANYAKQIQEFYDEWKHQVELQKMAEQIYQRVMKDINIKIVNDAEPAIQDLVKQIDRLLGR